MVTEIKKKPNVIKVKIAETVDKIQYLVFKL
jgi:hypothetical protein